MRKKSPAWLWAVPVFSCGSLAAVPPFVLALKLRTQSAWAWFAGFAALTVGTFVLIGSQPEGAQNLATATGSLFAFAALIGSPIYSVVVGKQVDWGPALGSPPPPPPPLDRNAAAVAQAHAARRRRTEALELATRDPQLARDLRIGRPDLPRQYDDGGLVDVNHAPAGVIVQGLGLDLDDFERVRDRIVLL